MTENDNQPSNQVFILKYNYLSGTKKRVLQLTEDYMLQVSGNKEFLYEKCKSPNFSKDFGKVSFQYSGKFRELIGNETTLDQIFKKMRNEISPQDFSAFIKSNDYIAGLTGNLVSEHLKVKSNIKKITEVDEEEYSEHSRKETRVDKQPFLAYEVTILHHFPKEIPKQKLLLNIEQNKFKLQNDVYLQYLENDNMEYNMSILNFNFHDIVPKRKQSNSFLLSKDIHKVDHEICSFSTGKQIKVALHDIFIYSLYLDTPQSLNVNPFATTDRFDKQPCLNLFNEIMNCLFNTNQHLRIKKGYDKFKIYQLGPYFKTLFNLFFDKVIESGRQSENKVGLDKNLNKDVNEFIKDQKDCILDDTHTFPRYYTNEPLNVDIQSLDFKQLFTIIIDLLYRSALKFVLNLDKISVQLDSEYLNECVGNQLDIMPKKMVDFNLDKVETQKMNHLKSELDETYSDQTRLYGIKEQLKSGCSILAIQNIPNTLIELLDSDLKQVNMRSNNYLLYKGLNSQDILIQDSAKWVLDTHQNSVGVFTLELRRFNDDLHITLISKEFDANVMDSSLEQPPNLNNIVKNVEEIQEDKLRNMDNNSQSENQRNGTNSSKAMEFSTNRSKYVPNDKGFEDQKANQTKTSNTNHNVQITNENINNEYNNPTYNDNHHQNNTNNLNQLSLKRRTSFSKNSNSNSNHIQEFKYFTPEDNDFRPEGKYSHPNQQPNVYHKDVIDSPEGSNTKFKNLRDSLKKSTYKSSLSPDHSMSKSKITNYHSLDKFSMKEQEQTRSEHSDTQLGRRIVGNNSKSTSIWGAIDTQFNCTSCRNICNEEVHELNDF